MTPSSQQRTYYDVLGVDPSADDNTIRKAYLRASLKHHPDKNPDDLEGAKARFVEIGVAYETLSDPVKRAAYDRNLRQGAAGGPAAEFAYDFNDERTYESFREAFDATVAGMSEADLAAAMGTAAMVGSVVGSIVGRRMSKGSGFLATAGSLVGSAMASQAATSAVKALHQQSVERVAYTEECKRAVARGDPRPEPPPGANLGKSLKETVSKTMESMRTQRTQPPSHSGQDDYNSNGEHQQRGSQPSLKERISKATETLKQNVAAKAAAAAVASAMSSSSNCARR